MLKKTLFREKRKKKKEEREEKEQIPINFILMKQKK